MASKKRQMQTLPKDSPRVRAAKMRYAYDPSAQTLADQLKRSKGKGHFRYRGGR